MSDWERLIEKLMIAALFISCGVVVGAALYNLHNFYNGKECARSVPVIIGKTVTSQCAEYK